MLRVRLGWTDVITDVHVRGMTSCSASHRNGFFCNFNQTEKKSNLDQHYSFQMYCTIDLTSKYIFFIRKLIHLSVEMF